MFKDPKISKNKAGKLRKPCYTSFLIINYNNFDYLT